MGVDFAGAKSMKHDLKQAEKDHMIRELSDYLFRRHGEIAAAYCHGSFLVNSFADIDLGLLLYKVTEEPLAYEMSLETELEKLLPHRIDIRIINEAPISFCQAVFRGKVILDRDPNHRAEFETRVLKEYFDFAIFRQRYLAEVLNAPL
jgi:predicted nucleotidyltransferase